jgi:hypothetical protein
MGNAGTDERWERCRSAMGGFAVCRRRLGERSRRSWNPRRLGLVRQHDCGVALLSGAVGEDDLNWAGVKPRGSEKRRGEGGVAGLEAALAIP